MLQLHNSYKFKKIFLFLSLLSLLILNFWFWHLIKNSEKNTDYLYIPDHPKIWQSKIYSVGDDQLFFRISALRLQNFADYTGHVTRLMDYDFEKLQSWMYFLDKFDSDSHFIPSIAAYYYGGVPVNEKKIKIAQYLEQYSKKNFEDRWWWMTQAILLASKAKDHEYASRLALSFDNYYFEKGKDIPTWVKFLPAIYTAKMGDKEKAYQMLKLLYENRTDLDKFDYNYMNHFIKIYLKELEIDEEFKSK